MSDDSGGIKDELPPITTFLNRLLALTIRLQNILFTAFEQLLTTRIEGAIASGVYDVGLETLTDEVAVQPVELAIVGNCLSMPETFCERRLEQHVSVDRAEDLVHRLPCGRRADAGAFDLSLHAQPASLANGRLAARDGFGDHLAALR